MNVSSLGQNTSAWLGQLAVVQSHAGNLSHAYGHSGCLCINPTVNYTTLHLPICTNGTSHLPNCYPQGYGSSCITNDLIFKNEKCQRENNKEIPKWCFDKWCYVDKDLCADSNDIFSQSIYFPDLYFSYTTCDSGAGHFSDFLRSVDDMQRVDQILAIRGKDLVAAVPSSHYPYMFKLNSSGGIAEYEGSEYFDNNIPWKGGAVLDYLNALSKTFKPKSIRYVHRSHGADLLHNDSAYTATVSDVGRGVVDFGAGIFWVTADRLKMASFTVPIDIDNFGLFVSKKGSKRNFRQSLILTLKPFAPPLWLILGGMILLVTIFGIWFSTENNAYSDRLQLLDTDNFHVSWLSKIRIGWSVLIQSCLDNTTHFFSGGIGPVTTESTSFKLLMMGFGFVTMIAFASYTAMLTTLIQMETIHGSIKSMDDAIAKGKIICAPTELKHEFRKYSNGNFIFFESVSEESIEQVFKDYDSGKCHCIVCSLWEAAIMDIWYENIQAKDLYSIEVVHELYIALSAQPHIAGALSYYIQEGRENGVTLKNFLKDYLPKDRNLDMKTTTTNAEDASVKAKDVAAPIAFFIICLLLGIILKLNAMFCKCKRGGIEVTTASRRVVDVEDLNDLSMSDLVEIDETGLDINQLETQFAMVLEYLKKKP